VPYFVLLLYPTPVIFWKESWVVNGLKMLAKIVVTFTSHSKPLIPHLGHSWVCEISEVPNHWHKSTSSHGDLTCNPVMLRHSTIIFYLHTNHIRYICDCITKASDGECTHYPPTGQWQTSDYEVIIRGGGSNHQCLLVKQVFRKVVKRISYGSIPSNATSKITP
jgi:hypothetical protein